MKNFLFFSLMCVTVVISVSYILWGGGKSERYNTTTLHSCDIKGDSILVDCQVCCYDNKQKTIVFTWDDSAYGLEDVADIFNTHNFRTTFFINTKKVAEQPFSKRHPFRRKLKNVINNVLLKGHEISSHTHNHLRLGDVSNTEIEQEMSLSSKSIYDMFGYYPSTLSHPESVYSYSVDSIMHLYYLDSRYSMSKDNDSTVRYMQVRTAYSFNYYKKNIDSFINSNADTYIFGGHQLENEGYEPMPSTILDSILNYISFKYIDYCWITTFEDMTLYNIIRDDVIIENTPGKIVVNTTQVDDILNHFSHPHAVLTLRFIGENVDFVSDGMVLYRYDGQDTYCTIDLRKSNLIKYSVIDKNFDIQKPIRTGLNK